MPFNMGYFLATEKEDELLQALDEARRERKLIDLANTV